jgi:hypothetical protein
MRRHLAWVPTLHTPGLVRDLERIRHNSASPSSVGVYEDSGSTRRQAKLSRDWRCSQDNRLRRKSDKVTSVAHRSPGTESEQPGQNRDYCRNRSRNLRCDLPANRARSKLLESRRRLFSSDQKVLLSEGRFDPRLRENPPQLCLTVVCRRIDEDPGSGRGSQAKFSRELRDCIDALIHDR